MSLLKKSELAGFSGSPAFYFIRRLTIAKAAMPSIRPAMIDSHGKPGIAGNTIGVETEIVVELLVVVGVLMTVIVDTAELTMVVVSAPVVDAGIVEADVAVSTEEADVVDASDEAEAVVVVAADEADDVVATEEADAVVAVELELEAELALEVVVATCWPATGGFWGSRWNIPESGFVPVDGPAPTAHPSCGLVR